MQMGVMVDKIQIDILNPEEFKYKQLQLDGDITINVFLAKWYTSTNSPYILSVSEKVKQKR